MLLRSPWLAAALALLTSTSTALAFSFTSGSPTQCDDLSISWTGGTPPFQLLMSPVFGSTRNVSIPSNSFSNGKGSLSVLLPFPEKQKFILTMSDATGFGSGGSTDILTVGASKGGSCNTTDPGVDFQFELNSALQQCRPYVIDGYPAALQPVTIIAMVPGGTSLVISPPPGSSNYVWNADVAHGTSMIFMMFDSRGRNGGSSDIKTVGITDDTTCLSALSPSSTAASQTSSPTSTGTSTSGTPTTSPSPTAAPAKGTSIAAIAGTVIGALVFLAVAVTLGLFFLRKKRDTWGPGSTSRRHSRRMQSEVDLTYDPSHAPNNYPYSSSTHAAATPSPMPFLSAGNPYDSNPFLDSDPQQQHSAHYQPPSQYLQSYQTPSHDQASSRHQTPSHHQSNSLTATDVDSFDPYALNQPAHLTNIQPFDIHSPDQSTSRDSMSTTQRKAAMAGAHVYKPSRFIVHTDVEDELPPPNEDGIVELPPQYSERRGPLGSVPHHNPSTSHDLYHPNPPAGSIPPHS